jgi:hypothetical protein
MDDLEGYMEGWIKLHRKIASWQWASSPNHMTLFMQLLLRANYKTTKWRMETIQPGQLLTGRKQLMEWTGLTERQVRKCLDDLETTKEIVRKRAAKYSIITIANWETYQSDDREMSGKCPADVQQTSTSKKDNNTNKEKNINIKASPLSFLFHHRPDIQDWLNKGNHDTHLIIVRERSHHEIVDLIPKAYDWALPKNMRAESFLITFFNNKNTHGYGANQAQKSFKRKGAGLTPTPENPTGDPYLQEAIDKGLAG